MSQSVTELHRGRVRALDGLRGLAALVVLEYHALLASSRSLAAPYDAGPPPRGGSLDWLLTYTPLHVLWAGPELVVVFFVLSGFVLSLPVARGGRLRIAAYYPARLLRLYLPVWGALALAAALHVAVAHRALAGASWWLNAHRMPLETSALRRDALLELRAGDWGFTSVLWSLHWEVLFSLLLPALLALAARLRAAGALAAALCFAAMLLAPGGRGGGEYVLALAPFLLGMLLAFAHEPLARLAARLRERSVGNVAIELALGVACVCALTARWWLPAGVDDAAPLVAAGACLAVVAALVADSFGRFLRSRPLRWTGRRAYSVYLVHEPLVVALAFVAGGRLAPAPFALLASVFSLVLAAVFFALVERPSHRLARRWATRGARGGRAGSRVALSSARV